MSRELDAELRSYYWLKKMHANTEKRLARSRTYILSLVDSGHTAGGGYQPKVQIKRSKVDYDEDALAGLLEVKGLWKEACKEVIDENLVKSLYLQGKLTDDDLRSVLKPSTITTALTVDKVDEDVQGHNEGVRTESG